MITNENVHENKLNKKKSIAIDNLKVDYREDWCERTEFEVCDAAKKLEKYVDENGKDFTHIYSYNKVMSY